MRRNKQSLPLQKTVGKSIGKRTSSQGGNPSHSKISSRSKKEELVVCGWNACQHLFEKRPGDILRLYFSKGRAPELKPIVKFCASRKLPYRRLTLQELEKVSSSVHHEGVAMATKPPKFKSTVELVSVKLPVRGVWLALDKIGNVHNLGAIARTAAFFGAEGLIVSRDQEQASVTTSAFRTAEGAFDSIPLLTCRDLASALRDLKSAGAFVLGTDAKADTPLFETKLKLPCVLVVGNEREGLSGKVKDRCDAVLRIPGDGQIQSLNVSVATGIVLAELYKIKTMA